MKKASLRQNIRKTYLAFTPYEESVLRQNIRKTYLAFTPYEESVT